MSAAVETLYRVSAGDSLTKIAQKFYGDARRYADIARINNIDPAAVLFIGQPLRLPALSEAVEEVQITAQRLPATASSTLPTGGAVLDPTTGIETVTTTAYVWWKDWRWYAGIGVGVAVLWYFTGKRR